MKMLPHYLTRRLENEKRKGTKTVSWNGKKVPIAEAIRKTKCQADDALLDVNGTGSATSIRT